MKKIVALAILLVVTCNVSAQKSQKDRIGVRAGYSSMSLSEIAVADRESFYVGAILPLRLAKWYAFQPEINYSRQGARVNRDLPFEPIEGLRSDVWKMDYLGVAVSNKFYVFRGFNLMLTPYFDFLVRHNDFVEPAQDVDVGCAIGFGYDLNNGIGIEARIKSGFSDVITYRGPDPESTGISNVGGQIGLTYTF